MAEFGPLDRWAAANLVGDLAREMRAVADRAFELTGFDDDLAAQ
jgi:hypothetical protein